MDRETAIAWLRSVGRNARARDWVFGGTIVITVGEPTLVDAANDIRIHRGAVYLYPTADGGWNLLDLDLPDPAATYANLETATHAVHAYIEQKERALRKP